MKKYLCGNAGENVYLTFKGGCRKEVLINDLYRCTGCGGRFHKDCILEHFKLEKDHDFGRREEREEIKELVIFPERFPLKGDKEGELLCAGFNSYRSMVLKVFEKENIL